MTSRAALEEVIHLAWIETLAPVAIDPAWTWEEAGADSLLSLNLLLRLEKKLGRKLTFDIIDPDMTIQGLAERLAAIDESPSLQSENSPAPTLFLVPGIFGDEPILADFRRWFGSRLRFNIVDLPEIDQSSKIHISMAQTGDHIAHQIEDRQPTGDLMVAGYSFGGCAAFEATRALVDKGRQVAFLCMLDAAPDLKELSDSWGEKHRGRKFSRTIVRSMARSDVARGAMVRLATWLRPHAAISLRRQLMRKLRGQALAGWKPKTLHVPVLLVISEERKVGISSSLWPPLPKVAALLTPGGHRDLFQPAAMARLGPAVLTAVTKPNDLFRNNKGFEN